MIGSRISAPFFVFKEIVRDTLLILDSMNFESDNSIFWLIPAVIVAFFLARWFYSAKSPWVSELAKKWRWTLIALRTASFTLIAILLLGIIFQAFTYRTEKPILVIGVDTSNSMLNYKDSASVQKQVRTVIDAANERLSEKFDIVSYAFGGNLSRIDSLSFNGVKTDLSKSFNEVHAEFYNRNLGGVVVISDGNFNSGSNPIYAARKLTLTPIYSLGVGDTVLKRDHFIKNVAVNDVAFINNEFPLVVDVEGNMMGKVNALVTIQQNGKTIASQTVSYDDGISDFKQVSFLLKATGTGFQKYSVHIEDKNNESNYQNNSRIFYIEVIDSRSKVLFLADAPHPDIAAIKSVFDEDENLETDFSTLADWDKNLKNVDLIVWHEAGRACPKETRDLIQKSGISKLYILGPNSERSATEALGIGVGLPSGNQLDDVEASTNDGFQQFEVSQELVKAFQFFPPLKTKFGKLTTSPGVDILAYQRIGPIVKKEPQLFFGKLNNFKYGVIYGEGIWRWKMAEYGRFETNTSFNELIAKIGQFLLVKQNSSPLRITLPKKFNKDENVIVNATFLNQSLEPITTPVINFELVDENKKESKLQFGAIGKGYQLDLGQLKPGQYSWKAFTQFDGKKHEKSGVFVVEDQNAEKLDTRANHTLLNQLAMNSGGKFQALKNYEQTLNDLLKREDLTTVSYQESSFNDLIDYLWGLLILLLLLSTEWFLRRWLGSY